jgi:hypothetical protein
VFLKITANINRINLLPGNAVRSVLFCLTLVASTYAEGDMLLPCAQQYPGDDAARLKCYDRSAVSAPTPSAQKSTLFDEDAETSTTLATPAATATLGADRSYLTRVWNMDDLSNRDPSKLGRLQPYRQNYLIVKKTNSPNYLPSSPLPDQDRKSVV